MFLKKISSFLDIYVDLSVFDSVDYCLILTLASKMFAILFSFLSILFLYADEVVDLICACVFSHFCCMWWYLFGRLLLLLLLLPSIVWVHLISKLRSKYANWQYKYVINEKSNDRNNDTYNNITFANIIVIISNNKNEQQ